RGQIEEAAEVHSKAVQIDPNSAEAQYALGRDMLDLGRTAEAIEALRRALQINPNNAEAQNDLDTALHKDTSGSSGTSGHSEEGSPGVATPRAGP
ncbi:MAG TPA: tetratricopeptide repeat protein, partial [Phycisphaerae bacterium]|nr:tetratricopeptide repeat protein [Phycisphaerae bacterium]